MVDLNKVREQFTKNGFGELPLDKIPKSLRWSPDLIVSKEGYTYLVLIKSNNSVPPMYLTRIADIPKGKVAPVIIFSQRPSTTHESLLLSMGISTGCFLRGKLANLNIQKKISDRVVHREVQRKLEVIDIFVSSRQEIAEREFVKDRIEMLRGIHFYPFNSPRLIEHDRFQLGELYNYIDSILNECEWIFIILEDIHSPVVSYELTKAIEEFEHENIFMFVKSTSACQTAWKKELAQVQKLKSKSIKYLPYSNQSELERDLSRAVNRRMAEIYKKEGIKRYL